MIENTSADLRDAFMLQLAQDKLKAKHEELAKEKAIADKRMGHYFETRVKGKMGWTIVKESRDDIKAFAEKRKGTFIGFFAE